VGQAILHVHTTLSDGTSTVEEILDDADRQGEINIVGITDHDDTQAFARALQWKADHPESRVQPIWASSSRSGRSSICCSFGSSRRSRPRRHPSSCR